jgi:hypothetical protein
LHLHSFFNFSQPLLSSHSLIIFFLFAYSSSLLS